MAWRAPSLFLLAIGGIAGASVAAPVERGDDWQALGSPSATIRKDAAARLRSTLAPSDAPAILEAARRGDVRVRRAIDEILLDREDLGLAFLRSLAPEDRELAHGLARAALARRFPNANESALDTKESLRRLEASRGDARFVECRVTSLPVDSFAAEIRWSGLAPFPILVAPEAPEVVVPLARAVLAVEALTSDAPEAAGLSISAVGDEAAAERFHPAFVVLGGAAARPAAEHAERWLDLWLWGADERHLSRAAVSLLALGVAPLDRLVVEALAAPAPTASLPAAGALPTHREAAFAAACASPARGASLVAASAAALDGFLGIVERGSSVPIPQIERCLAALPKADASGRAIDPLLVSLASRPPAARAPRILAILALRRATAAAAAFREAAASLHGERAADGLLGLQLLDDAGACEAASEVFRKSDDPEALAAAARIVASHPDRIAPLLGALDGATGVRRVVLAALLLRSRDSAAVAAGARAIAGIVDPPSLAALTKDLDPGSFATNRAIVVPALLPAADRGDLASLVVAATAGLVPREQRAAFAQKLVAAARDGEPAAAFEAAGRIAPTPFVLDQVRALFRGPAQPSKPRAVAIAILLGTHLGALERRDRETLVDTLTTSFGGSQVAALLFQAQSPALLSPREVVLPGRDGSSGPSVVVPWPAVDRGEPFPSIEVARDR